MTTKNQDSRISRAAALRTRIDRQAHGPVTLSRSDAHRLFRIDPLLRSRVAFIR